LKYIISDICPPKNTNQPSWATTRTWKKPQSICLFHYEIPVELSVAHTTEIPTSILPKP